MDPTIPDELAATLNKKNVSAERQTATTGCPVSPSTVRPAARIYEPQRETHSETIPDLNIVRTLPTANRFVHEISWSSSRRKYFAIAVRKIPNAVDIPELDNEHQDRSVFWIQIPSGSYAVDSGVEMATSVGDLKTTRSNSGSFFPTFEMLGEKIATALRKIIQNSNVRKGFM